MRHKVPCLLSEIRCVVPHTIREHCLSVALVAILGAGFIAIPVLSPLQGVTRDALLRAATAWPPTVNPDVPDVIIVALDSQSLRIFPEWPWPRGRYGQAIRQLHDAGAKVIAFDIDFSSPQNPVEDAKLASAITASGRVLLAGFRQFQHVENVGDIEIASFPIPRIAAGAAMMAAAIVPLDDDGSVREAFYVPDIAGRRLPSLARASLAQATGSQPVLQGEGRFPIDFRRAKPHLRILPIADVMEGRFDPSEVDGHVVFVGATAPILQDLWPTPVAPSLPGVVIQAIEYRQHVGRLSGQPILTIPGPGVRFGIVLLLSIVARLVSIGSPSRRWAGCLALCMAIPAACLGLVVATGFLLEPMLPLLVVLTHYALGLERVRVRIRRRLRAREVSMSAIAHAGQITKDPFGQGGIKTVLRLLAQATGARSISLLRVGAEGRFTPEVVAWAKAGHPPAPDLDRAQQVLASREIRVFAGPGSQPAVPSQILYAPLVAGNQPIGLLMAHYESREPPNDVQVSTVTTMGGQIALATANEGLIEDLRSAKDDAEAANRAKTEFLANMSHEIRTPMTAILGYIDLMADPETPDDHKADLMDVVRRNGEHLLNLISDILDLSQIEAGRMSMNLRIANPTELCRDIETLLRPQANEKGLSFKVTLADDLPEAIQTDPLRLGQILMNVIGNAIKFTESGSVTVDVSTQQRPGRRESFLRFDVTDTGMGMDSKTQARIFERFIQADMSATRKHGGTGLGLAITKRLVDTLGGTITCESEVGQGTTFTFTIETGVPIEPEVEEPRDEREAERRPRPTTPASAPTASAGSGRVLLAEDGPDNQKILSLFLRKAGFTVEVVEHGELACKAVLASFESGDSFDLILMDIDMPVMNGYEATRLIRDAGFSGPIVALTAHALPGDRERCLEAGCDDYMTKPAPREKLVELAARYVGEKKEPRA